MLPQPFDSTIIKLVVVGLATWRASFFLVHEEGPFRLMRRIRVRTGIRYDEAFQVIAWPSWNMLYCVYCTSFWVGLLLWFLPPVVSLVLAVSCVACLVDRWHSNG